MQARLVPAAVASNGVTLGGVTMAMTNAERQRRFRARKRAAKQQAMATAAVPVRDESDLVAWLSALEVTQGPRAGERLEVLAWQARFLEAVQKGGGAIGLTVARGAGKSTFAAAICAAAVVGPLAQRRGQVLMIGATFRQARIVFQHAVAFLDPWLKANPGRYRVNDSERSALVVDKLTGSSIEAREAVPASLHGAAPAVVVCDEPAQWQANSSEAMYSALRTSLGKLADSRLIAIGTLPSDGDHWFCRLLRRNGVVHAADANDDPFDPATWHKANPSLSAMPALLAMYEEEAREAQNDDKLIQQFRALRLNMGTVDHHVDALLSVDQWRECECDLLPAASGPFVLALDLSGGSAMSACAGYWVRTGRVECIAAFPAVPTLAERSRADGGADYEAMAKAGDLLVIGRRVVPVADLLRHVLEVWGRPALVTADYHAVNELREALEAARVPLTRLESTSLGWKHCPELIRRFRRSVIGGRVHVKRSVLLRQAFANARVRVGPGGDEAIIKGGAPGKARRARDDAAVAVMLAVAMASKLQVAGRKLRHAVAS